MKKNGFKWAVIFILIAIIASNILPAVASAMAPPYQAITDETTKQQILNATIRITMLFPSNNQQAAAQDQQAMSYTAAVGLATVATYKGETIIVTHDHWNHPMAELALVEFRNANNEFLMEMDGAQFSNLIRYRDNGTMIIATPAGLNVNHVSSTLAEYAIPRPVVAGDVVMVVHQQPGNESQATVLEAVVESIGLEQGNTTFGLRSLDGQAIVHGDSGGGVFLNGQLAGNLWSTDLVTGRRILGLLTIKSDKTATDSSTAARLPLELLSSS